MLDAEMLFKMILKKGISPADTYFLTASNDQFASIRKVNVLVMDTICHANSEMIALKKAICERFDNDSHVVDTIMTLDDFMERRNPIHFDYFVFMNDWSTTAREGIVKKLYFENCPWEYVWRDNELIPINHEKDADTKLRALEKELRDAEC